VTGRFCHRSRHARQSVEELKRRIRIGARGQSLLGQPTRGKGVAARPSRFGLDETQVRLPAHLGEAILRLLASTTGFTVIRLLPKDAAEGPACLLEPAPREKDPPLS
jgi:hypothetical protein